MGFVEPVVVLWLYGVGNSGNTSTVNAIDSVSRVA